MSSLPTLDKLGVKLPETLDVERIASEWFHDFASRVTAGNAWSVSEMLFDGALWRDMLALTWEFRTFEGTTKIKQALHDLLPIVGLSKLQLKEDSVQLQQPFPDLAWIQGVFTFETVVGIGFGVFRIVPTASQEWKGYTLYTNLEELKGFPERTGLNRDSAPNHGMWPQKRKSETEFKDGEPAVVIIGGGHSGLEIAARLKLLGVSVLILEKNARVGDQWRGRYDSLCLHDPVWYDHMPYIPFPSSWPVWTPAPKLADWLESYAQSMELDIWVGTEAKKVEQLRNGQGWVVTTESSDGSSRMLRPRHVVIATGFGGGEINMPTFSGMEEFEGKIVHAMRFKTAKDHVGKKVVIIGSCTSAHDVAFDHCQHGIDVTMYQRSSTYIMSTEKGVPILFAVGMYCEGGPPTDLVDRMGASVPWKMLIPIQQRLTKIIAEQDAGILKGLEQRGFKLTFGPNGAGIVELAYTRAGGYYLDVGASQLIIDGKIKLKNDSAISRFSRSGIVFEDGSELPADVVIFATGLGNTKTGIAKLVGEEVVSRLSDMPVINDEGEMAGLWRHSGVQGLYLMIGNLSLSRFHSKHLALLIKAQEEGIAGERYTK
ncbi:FAD/NAD-binding domain-containing protein [Fomitiporia mediterranea MF3/22]|uniref:FAD/NAD-binding domain-containing protein n=1 Tax=Fomitiporia mediterranea (strain MF3/22) TaxID=694068 RepID=UPI00044082DD|nr:FAD/NAD-binding domain-containing protein [Fomitiporia mediterranea MF3/22]EJD00098.1 FAD/NAD-binding domain-containing protein [Fomitiporia mediterranea MF3/22]